MEQNLRVEYTHYPGKPEHDIQPAQQGVLYKLEEEGEVLIAHVAVGELHHEALLDCAVGSHASGEYAVTVPKAYGDESIVAYGSWPHHIDHNDAAFIIAAVKPSERNQVEAAHRLAVTIGFRVLAAAKLSLEDRDRLECEYTEILPESAVEPIVEAERHRLVYIHE